MARKNDKDGGDNSSKGEEKEMLDALFREELDVRNRGAQRPKPSGKDVGIDLADSTGPGRAFCGASHSALHQSHRRLARAGSGKGETPGPFRMETHLRGL